MPPLDIDHSRSSPNHSSRNGRAITMIVGHATVGPFVSSLNWLCNPASRVSSHYLISKTGHIAQLVADSRAAWHAGIALWDGDTAINEASLGIELENLTGMAMPDGTLHPPDPYPAVQITAFRELVQSKMAQYAIPLSRVLRHLDVAMPRGRKTDPANFDWRAFLASLAVDPLRISTIPAAGGGFVHCGSGMAAYYRTQGGFDEFGYGQTDETRDLGLDGRACTWLRCERAVLKYVEGEGVHLALESEALAKGWIG